jgi:hypothetical protein
MSRVLVAPTQSAPATRSALRTLAVVGQFGLDLDRLNPRYGNRDIDGNPATLETTCNYLVRDFCAAMRVPLQGARANDMVAWLASQEASLLGWAVVSEHAARGCAAEGFAVLAGWFNRNGGPGHVAVVVPSLEEDGTYVAQSGALCFSHGLIQAGFGSLAVTYFAHA